MDKAIKYLVMIMFVTTVIGLIQNDVIFNAKCYASVVFSENVEALTECDATFPNADGKIVTIHCVGEKGTCNIKRKEKVSTPYGDYTVLVDASCS
ncbi:MAG: hypothetical protein ACI4GD_10290 [Lachnospiraceae bacterium]